MIARLLRGRFFRGALWTAPAVFIAYWLLSTWWHESARDRASQALTAKITTMVKAEPSISLLSLVEDGEEQIDTICILTPYQMASDVLPPGTDLGWDAGWLHMVDEGFIGFVALNGAGDVALAARLVSVDMEGPGRCYSRADNPQIARSGTNSAGDFLITIRTGATPPA